MTVSGSQYVALLALLASYLHSFERILSPPLLEYLEECDRAGAIDVVESRCRRVLTFLIVVAGWAGLEKRAPRPSLGNDLVDPLVLGLLRRLDGAHLVPQATLEQISEMDSPLI